MAAAVGLPPLLLVVLGMGHDAKNEHSTDWVSHAGNQTVLVPGDVEHHAITDRARVPECCSHLSEVCPVGRQYSLVPNS